MTEKISVVQVFAPAKINLSLRILNRRPDGFHEIETLIAPIALCDELNIEKQPRGIDFSCDDVALPGGDENLVVRAAKKFLEVTNINTGLSIQLKKKIPHGAGLGGGSSDAASALLGLNGLFQTNLSRQALAKIAESIGSDVPFFIFQSAAWCKGRGEIVSPIKLKEQLRNASRAPTISGLSILLLKPEFGVASEWAYKRWKCSREIPGVTYAPQEFAGSAFFNDLEQPVFEKFVFLAQMKAWLLIQPEVGAAIMSGSGSTMFAVMRPNAEVDLLTKRAQAELDPQLWFCTTCTR